MEKHISIKPETLEKIQNDKQLWIGTLTGKLQGFHGLTHACTCNEHCAKLAKNPLNVCSNCYGFKGLKVRKSAKAHYERNSALLSERIIPMEELPYINDHVFRFETHGDWINMNSALNEIHIAEKNPHCHFTVWTKRIDILWKLANTGIKQPDNFHIKISSIQKNKVLPQSIKKDFAKKGWKTTYFTVVELPYLINTYGLETLQKDGDKIITCGGRKCMSCMKCYGDKEYHDEVELLKEDVAKAKKQGVKIGGN